MPSYGEESLKIMRRYGHHDRFNGNTHMKRSLSSHRVQQQINELSYLQSAELVTPCRLFLVLIGSVVMILLISLSISSDEITSSPYHTDNRVNLTKEPYHVNYKTMQQMREEMLLHYGYSSSENKVEKRSDISLQEFWDLYDGKWPIVILDIVPKWHAYKKWGKDFFSNNYGADRIILKAVEGVLDEGVAHIRDMKSFISHLEQPSQPDSWTYMEDEMFLMLRPELKKHIGNNVFMEENFFNLFPYEVRPWDCMMLWGTKYSRSTLHMDPYNWTAISAVIWGRKKWKVVIGNTYKVQWGRLTQVDDAEVIGKGSEIEMKELLKIQDKGSDKTTTTTTTTKRKHSPEKNRAKVIRTVPNINQESPDGEIPQTPVTPRINFEEEESMTGLTPLMAMSTPTIFRPARPCPNTLSSMMDVLKSIQGAVDRQCSSEQLDNERYNEIMTRIDSIEAKVDSLIVQQTQQMAAVHEPTQDVEPPVSCVSDELTRQLQREASSPGHFAALLLPHILPELFGPTNKRYLFNWNGTGGKQEICPQKKEMLRRTVNFYFPESRNQALWNAVVLRINERLRRVCKSKGKENRAVPQGEPFTELTFTQL